LATESSNNRNAISIIPIYTSVDHSIGVMNYRLFVYKTFRSQERKVPMENFRSPATKVPGTFVPGTFVPGNFRSRGTKVP